MHKTYRDSSREKYTIAVGAKSTGIPDSSYGEENRNIKDVTPEQGASSVKAAMERRLKNLRKTNPTDPVIASLEKVIKNMTSPIKQINSPEYRPIFDVFVKISSDMKERYESKLTDENGEKITLFADTEYDKWRKVMTHGEVIGVPSKLPADIYYLKNPGSPKPNDYMTSEEIEGIAGAYHPNKRDKVSGRLRVNNGAYQPEFETSTGKVIDIAKGDKIYFSYLAIGDETYIGRDQEGNLIYKIKYTELFCRVRESEITMLNGHCLVKPYFGKGFKETEVDGKKIQAKSIKAGETELVTELAEKPLYLQGILKHIGAPVAELSRPDCKPEDRIIFSVASEYEEEIEGDTFYVMRQWDLLAKVKENEFKKEELIPVGDYISVQTKQKPNSLIILLETDLERDFVPNTGTVLSVGCNVENLETGDCIHFDRGHGSHLIMKEFGITLMREAAVMCSQG